MNAWGAVRVEGGREPPLRELPPYSQFLVETAKANEIEPRAYLQFLFERFPTAQTTEDMKALMPQYLDRSLLPSLPKPKPRKKQGSGSYR